MEILGYNEWICVNALGEGMVRQWIGCGGMEMDGWMMMMG